MADDQEVYKYILKVENEESVKKAAASAALAEQKFRAMFDTFGAGAAQTKAAASSLVDVERNLKKLESAAGVSAHKIQVLGQGIDDLQYVGEQGLRPIINNVMQLSPAIGVALIAADQLYRHWDQLANLFGLGATKTEAERMEELAKKTEKTADETARLAKYEQLRKDIAAQGQKPEADAKFGAAVNKAVAEGPGAEVDKGLDKHFGDRIRRIADGDPRFADRNAAADRAIASHAEALRVARMNNNPELAALIEPELGKAQAGKDAIYGEARTAFRGELAGNPDRARAVAAAARAHPRDFGPGGEAFAGSLDAANDPAAAGRERIGDALGKVFDTIAKKLPELAKKAQKKIDDAAAKATQAAAEYGASAVQLQKDLRDSKIKAVIAEGREIARNADLAEAHRKQLDEEAKARGKEDLDRAKGKNPGVEGLVRDQLKAAGGGEGAVQAMIAKLTPALGAGAAAQLVREQAGGAREDLMKDFIDGPEAKQYMGGRRSGEAMADAILAGTGGDDTAKRQLEQLQRQTMLLNQIANGNGGGRALQFGANGMLGG